MAGIFINYRREDSQGSAGRLQQTLRAHFGADFVFMDVTAIAPGANFPSEIDARLQCCDVFLAVIGRHWLTMLKQREGDPRDFVHIEMAAALQRQILLIPCLVEGAALPGADQLPDDLTDLASRNAKELRHLSWDDDCASLIKAIDEYLSVRGAADTSPTWHQWLDQAKTGITRAFTYRVFDKFDDALPDWKSLGMPRALDEALAAPPQSAGRETCEALYRLVIQMCRVLQAEDVTLTAGESKEAQKRLKAAMGCAARLCLDPLLRSRLRPAQSPGSSRRLSAPASEIAGSTLIHREEPDKTWALPQTVGQTPLEDKAAIPITVETGDEASTREKLAKALARHTWPLAPVPERIDPTTCARLRGESDVARVRGEACYLVLDGKEESALRPSLEQWIADELRTEVLVLQKGETSNPLFLYDETTLLTLIAHFLRLLEGPEWNPR